MVESLLLGDMFIHFRVSDKVPRIELSVCVCTCIKNNTSKLYGKQTAKLFMMKSMCGSGE